MKINQNTVIAIFVIVLIYLLYKFLNKKIIEHLGPRDFLSSPTLMDGDKFMLRTKDGKYLTSCSDCKKEANIYNNCSYMLCLKRFPRNSSVFTLHQHRDGRVSIETATFHFWKHCGKCVLDCDGIICADGINKKLRSNKFIIIKNSNGTISIKAENGRLIQPCPCDQSCGHVFCSMGLGGDVEYIVEKVKVLPPPKRVLKFVPAKGRSSVSDGVSLSMLQ